MTGATTKDIGLRFKDITDPMAEVGAKINALRVNLGTSSACRSAQIVDSEIDGSLRTVELKFDAAGPINAGRCQMIASTVVAAGLLKCHDYDLETMDYDIPTITCTGDLVGKIKLTPPASIPMVITDIVIQGDLAGTIEIPDMAGDITADNLINGSLLKFDVMSGNINANALLETLGGK